MKCPACGQWFDMRDLMEVVKHVHNRDDGAEVGPGGTKNKEATNRVLLCWLCMQRQLFGFQTGNQFFDAVHCNQVANDYLDPLVTLDLFVILDALLAHRLTAWIRREQHVTLSHR